MKHVFIYMLIVSVVCNVSLLMAMDRNERLAAIRDFKRCERDLERNNRLFEKLQRSMDRYITFCNAVNCSRKDKGAFVQKIKSKRTYLQGRVDRVNNQIARISSELEKPECSSCITSQISLFCRNIESIYEQINEFSIEISDQQRSWENKSSVRKVLVATDEIIATARKNGVDQTLVFSADSVQDLARKALNERDFTASLALSSEAAELLSVPKPSQQISLNGQLAGFDAEISEIELDNTMSSKAGILIKQAREHFEKAESALNADDNNLAEKEIKIIKLLIQKARDLK